MTSTDIDISALPSSLRPTVAEGYRELAAGNYLLYAMTGTPRYLEIAEHAERKVIECERRGPSLAEMLEGVA